MSPRCVDALGLWMICQISDPLLQSDCSTVHHDGGRVKFTPEGVLVGVTNTESHLNISRHDLNAYGSKPLSVEIVKLPRHRQADDDSNKNVVNKLGNTSPILASFLFLFSTSTQRIMYFAPKLSNLHGEAEGKCIS